MNPSPSSAARIAPTRPSIMSEGAITSAPARAWLSDCSHQNGDGFVVEDGLALHHAVVAVAGVGVERDICDQADVGNFLLDRAADAADQIFGIERLRAVEVAQVGIGKGKKRDRRDRQFRRAARGGDRLVDRKALDLRHGAHWRADILAFDEKDRPDQVVGGQDVLAHQPSRPLGLAVAAGPVGKAEGKAEGGAFGVGHHFVP